MRRLRSIASDRRALAVAAALALFLVSLVVVAVIVAQGDAPRDRPVPTASERLDREARAGVEKSRAARARADESRLANRTDAGDVPPERPDKRASRSYRGQTMVPDELIGQRGEVSHEDVRLPA